MRKLITTPDNLRRLTALFITLSVGFMFSRLFTYETLPFYPAFGFLEDARGIAIGAVIVLALALVLVLVWPSRASGAILIGAGALFVAVDLNRFHPLMLNAIVLLLIPNQSTPIQIRRVLIVMLSVTFLFMTLNRINSTSEVAFELIVLQHSIKSKDVLFYTSLAVSILQGFVPLAFILFHRRPLVGTVLSIINCISFVAALTFYGMDPQTIIWLGLLLIISCALLYLSIVDNENESIDFNTSVNLYSGNLIVLAIVMLSFLGIGNKAFSFCLYSGREENGLLMVHPDILDKLPNTFGLSLMGLGGNPLIDFRYMLNTTCSQTLYPDPINIRNMVVSLKHISSNNEHAVLLVREGDELEIGKGMVPYLISDF